MDFKDLFFDNTDYDLTDQTLGKGTFGTVYLAKNLVDEKYYAAKIIDTKENFNGNKQMLFMRESLILHDLNHPAIVKFIGINFQSFEYQDKLEPTIITEYLKNGSLKSNLQNTKFTKTKQCIALIGIADALRYLHQMGILHRDLKSENILMDEDYYPRVCDFGLSRCFPQSLSKSIKLKMTSQFGTPLYNAPELFANEDEFGPGVDVYSYSLIAYEVLTRKRPFFELGKNLGIIKVMREVTNGRRPNFFDFDVTNEMKEFLAQCWCSIPEERPSFNEIYEKLTNDLSIFGSGFDEIEVKKYIKLLENARNNEPSKDKKELIRSTQNNDNKNQSSESKAQDINTTGDPNYCNHDIKKLGLLYYKFLNLYFPVPDDLNERYINGIFNGFFYL